MLVQLSCDKFVSMGVVRKTKSVNRLLHAFDQCETAISTIALVEQFKTEMNKSTVYRILDRLEIEGTLHSFIGKDGLRWYALTHCSHTNPSDIHPHFQCNECGKTECLPISISIPEVYKYNIESAALLLTGKCKNCIP